MKKQRRHFSRLFFTVLVGVVLLIGVLVHILWNNKPTIDRWLPIDRPPRIRPDYYGTVIPPNIAPLNFLVQEDGSLYCVRIHSKRGRTIEIFSKTAKIIIPKDRWAELLNLNQGQELYFDVFVKTDDEWNLFTTLTNKIAMEEIDGFLVYRKMHPTHIQRRGKMGIYQRNLENFDESLVLDNGYYKGEGGCLNCHAFANNRTNKMLMGLRSPTYGAGTLLIEDGLVQKIGTKFGYTSWHPSGRLVVYSINKIPILFDFAKKHDIRDTVDLNSLLAYYLVDSRTLKTSPKISQKERLETWPAWSGDGRYLYFCSTAKVPLDLNDLARGRLGQAYLKKIKYDLVRISYDVDKDEWGELETVLSSLGTGLSIAMPRVSPDGRWLSFCMLEYGYFPCWQESSDLYLIDLKAAEQTGQYKYRKLDISSDQSEAWQSWSSNSRWLAFSSKRDYGVFTRTYLSYVDQTGKAFKPILLPQKDPAFYDSCLEIYTNPELVIEPVQVTGEKLARVFRGSRKIHVDLPITMATPKAGAAPKRGSN